LQNVEEPQSEDLKPLVKKNKNRFPYYADTRDGAFLSLIVSLCSGGGTGGAQQPDKCMSSGI